MLLKSHHICKSYKYSFLKIPTIAVKMLFVISHITEQLRFSITTNNLCECVVPQLEVQAKSKSMSWKNLSKHTLHAMACYTSITAVLTQYNLHHISTRTCHEMRWSIQEYNVRKLSRNQNKLCSIIFSNTNLKQNKLLKHFTNWLAQSLILVCTSTSLPKINLVLSKQLTNPPEIVDYNTHYTTAPYNAINSVSRAETEHCACVSHTTTTTQQLITLDNCDWQSIIFLCYISNGLQTTVTNSVTH